MYFTVINHSETVKTVQGVSNHNAQSKQEREAIIAEAVRLEGLGKTVYTQSLDAVGVPPRGTLPT